MGRMSITCCSPLYLLIHPRTSCNGCRVLPKGCSEDCIIRPCLEWINSPESQANATVFLAKFYGRAGLINLINAGPQHLRPGIFRSLLHEACGRIVNPIYGSVGLLWSGSWQLCQAAVEAILKGEPITPITSVAAANGQGPPLKSYDIRHVSKVNNSESQRVKTRSRSKRVVRPKLGLINQIGSNSVEEASRSKSHESLLSAVCKESESGLVLESSILFHDKPQRVKAQSKFKRIVKAKPMNRIDSNSIKEVNWSKSHESLFSEGCKESESGVSMEALILFHDEPESEPKVREQTEESGSDEIGLELRLGFEPYSRAYHVVPLKKRKIELGLEFEFPA